MQYFVLTPRKQLNKSWRYKLAHSPPIELHSSVRLIPLLMIAGLAAVPIIVILAVLFINPLSGWDQLSSAALRGYILNTGVLMLMVGALAGIIGTLTAWCITALEFPGRKTLSWMLILPLSAPAYIVAYIYTDLMEYYGPVQSALRHVFGWAGGEYWFPNIRTLPGAALMLSIVLYPYVYLLARAAFLSQSQGQWQAARSLGLSPHAAFFRVALPAARPAIAGGLALVLMETLADFGVADFFAIPTFSTGIFRTWLAQGNKPAALKLAALMLLIVIFLLILESVTRRGRAAGSKGTSHAPQRIALSRRRAFITASLCSLPVIFGFLIPLITLIIYALNTGDNQSSRAFSQYAYNSFSTAMSVAFIVTFIAIGLAYIHRARSSRVFKASIKLSTLGYALPGAMLAIGLLYPLGFVDQSLTRLAKNLIGWKGGLLLTGTVAVLLYALSIRFLTVSFNSISSGFEKIPRSMDYAARSLGKTPLQLVRHIHFPLLRSSVFAGSILVFIDVMRELPATLILRPFNFDTLATRVYWLANDERLNEASTAALLIILIGTLPVLGLNLFLTHKKTAAQ